LDRARQIERRDRRDSRNQRRNRGQTSRFLISLPGCPRLLLRSEPPAVKLAPSQRLEHIYPKLGVENRTAAASFASELAARSESYFFPKNHSRGPDRTAG
jgi:hypothetical protein